MADGRRRRWVAHDVYFLDGPLGQELYDTYGATGIALWFGFIAAAKKHHIEGRITYSSDAEALVIFGLPGLDLTDTDGSPFTLDDFFQITARHKVTRRTTRGRRTAVVATRWDTWQDPRRTRPQPVDNPDDTTPGRASDDGRTSPARASDVHRTLLAEPPHDDDTSDAHEQTRRSDRENASTKHAEPDRDIPPDLDLDLDLDHDVPPYPPDDHLELPPPPAQPKGGGEIEDPLQHPAITDLPPRIQRAIHDDTPQARGRLAAAITRANGIRTNDLKRCWDDPTALDDDSIVSIALTLAHRIDDLAKEA